MTVSVDQAVMRPCECSLYSYRLKKNGRDVNVSTNCAARTADTFSRGHDAKLKSLLIAAGVLDLDVHIGGDLAAYPALSVAVRYGFGHMVRDGIIRGKAARTEAEYREALSKLDGHPQ